MLGWWRRLRCPVGKDSKSDEGKAVQRNARPPFSKWYTYGDHRYRYQGERVDVAFTDPQTGKEKLIVDNNGRICHFPGVVKEEFWVKELTNPNALKPVVRFRSEFGVFDDERYYMHWQVQPDGRYWADEDGFGWESDSEIVLQALIDRKGNFMGPFRIYSVDNKVYGEEQYGENKDTNEDE